MQPDLLGLVLLAVGSAFLTEVPKIRAFSAWKSQVVDFYNHQAFLESVIFTSANYIEILAFVGSSEVTQRIRRDFGEQKGLVKSC